jgi:hypothetical protein
MRRLRQLIGAAALILSSLNLLGCTRSAMQQKTPPDPLLWSKRPVAGKTSSTSESHQTSRLDAPPPLIGEGNSLAALAADRPQARLLPLERDGQ